MDKKKIFVGNLSYGTTMETLTETFLKFGEIVDSYKPEGKGFAFITFSTEEQAQNAVEGMNGQEVDGRALSVSIARPKEDRPRRSFGGSGDRRGGGGFNRDRGGDRRDFRNRY
jgi:RNA recognition motif-containing protein